MKIFIKPIAKGREPSASAEAKRLMKKLSGDLAKTKRQYAKGRSNQILATLLPSRLTQIGAKTMNFVIQNEKLCIKLTQTREIL